MNKENPFSPPAMIDADEETEMELHLRLRKIASAQRHVNVAVLLYFILLIAMFALPAFSDKPYLAGEFFVIAGSCMFIYGAISICRLAAVLRGTFRAIICVLGFLIPILGLLILISVNREATNILQRHRIKVGLLGANPKTMMRNSPT